MPELTIPKTELWFIDIKKYVYDSLVTYVPLLEIIGNDSVYFRPNDTIYDKNKPMVCISESGGNTDFKWIRNQVYQIDVLAESVEVAEKIKYIIVDLFNRRNFKGIRSKLFRTWPDMSNTKKWIFREILFFEFVFKDMKF